MARYIFLGINDDRDTCECCGRTNLKRVVWIEDTETGEVKHYGTTCATNPAKAFGHKINKDIRTASASFERRQREAHLQAWQMIRRHRPNLQLPLGPTEPIPAELKEEHTTLARAYYDHWSGATLEQRNKGAETMWKWENERKAERP